MNATTLYRSLSERLPKPDIAPRTGFWGGLGLTVLLASAGWLLARIPGLHMLGPMACTLLAAVACRHFCGYPEALSPGIRFSTARLLRLAVVLFGLRVPLDAMWRQGFPLLGGAAAVLAFSLVGGLALGRLFKTDRQMTLLLAIGTGVCGATAIAAVAPGLAAREDRTAASVGMVAVAGTLASVAYVLIAGWLPLDPHRYGIWAGLTLHETAQVAMAAGAGGPEALDSGMLAKLSRVFLLAPLCIALHVHGRRREKRAAEAGLPAPDAAASFPWFLLGFAGMSVLASGSAAVGLPLSATVSADATQLTTALLTVAMAGIGLNVNLRGMRDSLRPFALLLLLSALLSVLMLVFLL